MIFFPNFFFYIKSPVHSKTLRRFSKENMKLIRNRKPFYPLDSLWSLFLLKSVGFILSDRPKFLSLSTWVSMFSLSKLSLWATLFLLLFCFGISFWFACFRTRSILAWSLDIISSSSLLTIGSFSSSDFNGLPFAFDLKGERNIWVSFNWSGLWSLKG